MDGNYLLLSKWGSDIDYSYTDKPAVKTNDAMKTVKFRRLHDDYKLEEYMTPENKKVSFSAVLVFPKGVVPASGTMQIRLKEKVYSFNLDRE